MKAKLFWILFTIVIIVSLTGCSKTQGGATPTPDLSAATFNPIVNATGVVVPDQWAVLSAQTSGVVSGVLVADGDKVSQDQLLIQLSGIESAKARVTASQMEMADAQRAYDNLVKDASTLAAQAQSDIVKANDMIIAAEKALDDFEKNPYLDDIKTDQRDVNREKAQLDIAQKNFDKYASRAETDSTRKYYADELANQQRDYDAAVRDLLALEMKKKQAEADLAAGKALLDSAQRDFDQRKDGPSPADLLVVQSRLDNAKAQVDAAQTALDQLSLKATFAGYVSNPKVRAGESVTPGQPLLYLANTTTLQVETTDLNEIDVARLTIADPAKVTFDALPNVTVNGKVARIATKASEGSGVNYTVVITLDQIPEKLLWGMTAFVDIQVQK
jgi:HlyD family secretion protein